MTRRYALFSFDQLSAAMLHDILVLRAEVFVVEQNSPYLDPDAHDKQALHLCLFEGDSLIGYTRILPPGLKFAEASIGRIVIAKDYRGGGTGRKLVEHALQELANHHGDAAVMIEAQYHLREFYQSLGFVIVSDIYDWGGIEHVRMRCAVG